MLTSRSGLEPNITGLEPNITQMLSAISQESIRAFTRGDIWHLYFSFVLCMPSPLCLGLLIAITNSLYY